MPYKDVADRRLWEKQRYWMNHDKQLERKRRYHLFKRPLLRLERRIARDTQRAIELAGLLGLASQETDHD